MVAGLIKLARTDLTQARVEVSPISSLSIQLGLLPLATSRICDAFLYIDPGYSRFSFIEADSARTTGVSRRFFPENAISVSPRLFANNLSEATANNSRAGWGSGPNLSVIYVA